MHLRLPKFEHQLPIIVSNLKTFPIVLSFPDFTLSVSSFYLIFHLNTLPLLKSLPRALFLVNLLKDISLYQVISVVIKHTNQNWLKQWRSSIIYKVKTLRKDWFYMNLQLCHSLNILFFSFHLMFWYSNFLLSLLSFIMFYFCAYYS